MRSTTGNTRPLPSARRRQQRISRSTNSRGVRADLIYRRLTSTLSSFVLALRLAKPALRLRWQRPGSHQNTQTFPIRTIFSRSIDRSIETLDSINSSAVSFFQDLARRISQVSGDSWEASYLFQRISVTTQRFNSVLFRDSFVAHESQDDSDA